MPTIDDTIEQLRRHCADALLRAEQAFAEAERFRAALRALEMNAPLDAGTAARLAAAADLRPAATKARPDPPRPPKAAKRPAPNVSPLPRAGRPPIEEVARIANEARAAGEPMVATISERFDVPSTTVANWLTKARRLGLLDQPAGLPPGPPPAASAAERSTLEGVAHLEKLVAGELDDVS